MENFNYQEPCCIERTLPILVRQYGWLPWQSNGDITLDKILNAVSHLAGNRVAISFCIPTIDIAALRFFAWYHKRGWLTSLEIITSEDQTELIRAELPKELSVNIVSHNSVVETQPIVVIKGEKQTVIVQGPLHTTIAATPVRESFITYAGTDESRIAQFTATLSSLIRVATRKKTSHKNATVPDASASNSSAAVPAASPAGE